MTDAISTSPGPKRRSWLRALAWLAGAILVLLIVVYFVATSSAFFKGVILPKVGQAMNASITVGDASISPFSEVVLRDLKVHTTGTEPLLTAREVRARYHLMDILRGNIRVDEVTLSSPTVVLVENPDKSSNLDPIMKSQQAQPKPAPAQPSKPVHIELRKLTLTEATLRKVQMHKTGNPDVTELAHVNVTVDNVQNGQTGKLSLGAEMRVEVSPQTSIAGSLMQGKVTGGFDFTLTADLKPASVKGNARLEVSRAEGAWAELSGGGADLDCEVSPTAIKQLALQFQRQGQRLGEIRLSGPFDMQKNEGRLAVAIVSVDKQLLNLAGARQGLDFGSTLLNSTNDVQIAKGGSVITAIGQLALSKFEVKRANEVTPPLDLQAQYNVTLDLAQSNSLVREFNLTGTQRGKRLLTGELTSPMQVSWGKADNAVGDSTFKFTVADLNLRDWKPFLGALEPEGTVNVQAKVLSQQAGDQLTFDIASQLQSLSVTLGSNRLTRADIDLQVNGKSTSLKQFNLSRYELKVGQQGQPMLTVSGSGTYDRGTTNADMQVKVQAVLARLLQVMPVAEASISSGTVAFDGRVTQKQDTQSFAGKLALEDLTGRYSNNEFKSFGATMDLDATMTPQQLQLRKAAGKLSEGGNAGGAFDVSATFATNKAGQLVASLTDLNQHGLRPFLEPMLGDKKLVSVTFNGKASAQYDPAGASVLKADMQVANLVVQDAKSALPPKPLEAKLLVDASLRKDVADVRQCQLTLTPTARAKNELQLTGQVDMSQTNAITGQLKLAAEALDLTSYYDLFAGKGQASPAASQTPARTSAPAPAAPDKEPEATHLPLRNFTADARVGRLYLREVDVADFQATAKVDGGHVVLNPLKLTLNGAPADANMDVDMGVPGYKYSVAWNAQRIPLAPLVNSFQPERKGQMGGTLSTQARLSGAGITDAGLAKNLSGQFDLMTTNMNLAVVNIKTPAIKLVVNVVSLLPDLFRDPTATGQVLLQSAAGRPGAKSGLADAVQRSPLDSIAGRATVGAGRVDLQQAVVRSAAFEADASQGIIALGAPLTNSIMQIPVALLLSRPLAQQMNLVPEGTPTNATFVKLPDFLTMKGTFGKPEPDINKRVLLGTALTGIAGSVPKASGILQEVGGLLTGQRAATNAAPAANTNAPAKSGGSLLQGLGGLLREGNAPQAGQTNSPATNRPQGGSLLDDLLKPRNK
jgi:uncharacterized protein involved in outer membrane biogenesis